MLASMLALASSLRSEHNVGVINIKKILSINSWGKITEKEK